MQQQLDVALVSLLLKNKWIQKQQKKASFSKNDLKVHAVELFDWNGATIKNINKLDSLWHYYKMLHAAVLITNPNNGSVISYVGGNNFRTLPFNLIQSHRQIASAFKPILYASAIENGISPSSYLENTEKEYPEYENWKPRNFDYQSTPNSKVAFWFALANSMNLPTVDLYFKVGGASLKNTASKLGFPEFKEESPSVSLGTLDVSLEEIVKAYGAFANNGTLNSLVMIDRITDKKGKLLYENKSISKPALFNPFTAASITAILERAINEGTGTKIRTQFGIQSDLAGKTGTSQNYSNAWFVAYTPNIVIGTWVGASTPDIHFNSSKGSGASLALPITATVLKKMEANSVLKNKYLVPFQISEEVYSHLATDPYQEKGIEGFFKRLFNFKSNKTKTIENNKNSTKKKRKNR